MAHFLKLDSYIHVMMFLIKISRTSTHSFTWDVFDRPEHVFKYPTILCK